MAAPARIASLAAAGCHQWLTGKAVLPAQMWGQGAALRDASLPPRFSSFDEWEALMAEGTESLCAERRGLMEGKDNS